MRPPLVIAVLMVVAVVATCDEPAVASPSVPSAASVTPVPSLLSAEASPTHEPIGRLPDDCEPGPDPVLVSDHVGHGVGGDPAWAIGFGADATLGFNPDDPHEDNGWLRKVLWLLQSSADPVTVTGWRVDDDSPLWFAYPGPGEQAASLVLDPAAPDGHHGDWYEYRGYIVTPSAGCYRLEAVWPGGGWEIDFRAGLDLTQG